MRESGGALIVQYRETLPPARAMTAQVLTMPYHLVAIPTRSGEVKFEKDRIAKVARRAGLIAPPRRLGIANTFVPVPSRRPAALPGRVTSPLRLLLCCCGRSLRRRRLGGRFPGQP